MKADDIDALLRAPSTLSKSILDMLRAYANLQRAGDGMCRVRDAMESRVRTVERWVDETDPVPALDYPMDTEPYPKRRRSEAESQYWGGRTSLSHYVFRRLGLQSHRREVFRFVNDWFTAHPNGTICRYVDDTPVVYRKTRGTILTEMENTHLFPYVHKRLAVIGLSLPP